MNTSPAVAPEVIERLRQALESRNYRAFADCFTPDGAYELPYALPGKPSRYQGQDNIYHYIETGMQAANKLFDIIRLEVVVQLCAEENKVFVQFFLTGKRPTAETPFQIASSAALITCQGTKVSIYRDFPSSLGIAQAAGRLSEFVAALPQD